MSDSRAPAATGSPSPDDLAPDELKQLYRMLLFPRMIEEKMLLLLRQGKLSKWFSGIGQEAIAVGVTAALHADDWVLPMHRNLGVFTTRNLDLPRLLRQLLGKDGGLTKGRDRTFHFGHLEKHIVGMISHLGAMLPVADGLALAARLRGENRVAATFTGDGATSEGDFHEALNLAAVWKLPRAVRHREQPVGPLHPEPRAVRLQAARGSCPRLRNARHDRRRQRRARRAPSHAPGGGPRPPRRRSHPARVQDLSGCVATRRPPAPTTCRASS